MGFLSDSSSYISLIFTLGTFDRRFASALYLDRDACVIQKQKRNLFIIPMK